MNWVIATIVIALILGGIVVWNTSAMVTILPSLAVGILGGIIGGFGTRFLWEQYTKPDLVVNSIAKKAGNAEQGQMRFADYTINIHNKGKSPILNCRARVKFAGDNTEIIENPLPILGDEISSTQKYTVDYNLPWNITDGPESTTINPGEGMSVRLFSSLAESPYEGNDIHIRFYPDPSRDNGENPVQIREWAVENEFNLRNTDRIFKSSFDRIEWEKMHVEITGKNIPIKELTLSFSWDRAPVPDVTFENTE